MDCLKLLNKYSQQGEYIVDKIEEIKKLMKKKIKNHVSRMGSWFTRLPGIRWIYWKILAETMLDGVKKGGYILNGKTDRVTFDKTGTPKIEYTFVPDIPINELNINIKVNDHEDKNGICK